MKNKEQACLVRAHSCDARAKDTENPAHKSEWVKLSIEWNYIARYCRQLYEQDPIQAKSKIA